MVFYKQTDHTIHIDAKPRIKANLNAVIYSYDEHVNKFVFPLVSNRDLPIDLTNAKVKILLQYTKSDGKIGKFIDEKNGKVDSVEFQRISYELTNEMRYYQGSVAMNIYIDLISGEKIDIYDVSFTIKRSEIDDVISEAPDFYIASFDELLKQVEETSVKAKSNMTTIVQNVQTTADIEISKIEAIRPQLEQDTSYIKSETDKIVASGYLPKSKFSWANSEDMTTDFVTKEPNKNLFSYSKTTLNTYVDWTSGTLISSAGRFISDLIELKTNLFITVYGNLQGGRFVVFGYSKNDLTKATKRYYYESFQNLANAFAYQPTKIIKDPNIDFIRISFLDFKYTLDDVKKIKLKVEEDTKTLYTSAKVDNDGQSFMKYYATSNINSNDPKDFTRGFYTNEFIDYQIQKLSDTVFALGGSV